MILRASIAIAEALNVTIAVADRPRGVLELFFDGGVRPEV